MLGDLVVNLSTRTEKFTRGLNVARSSLSKFTSVVGSTLKVITQLGVAGGAAIGGLALASIKLAANAEQTAISFEVLTGKASLATKLIQDLRTMGAATPFEFGDLAGSTKMLLNFGISSEKVLEDLDMLSNVAAGDAQKLNSLALVFGQVAANARMTGGDLLQFINTGFNPLQQIAEKTGETMVQLRDRMSKGQIGFEEIREAIRAATSEGGRFYQMNEKQSKTLLGRWSTLKDGITEAMISVGQSIMDNMDLTGAIEQITEMANVFKNDLLPALARVLEELPKLGKILNEGILGKKAGDQLEKIAFTISAIAHGIGPQEAGELFAKIKQGQVDAPFNREAGGIESDAQKAMDAHRKALDQLPIVQRAEQTAETFISGQMNKGFDKRTAIDQFAHQFEEAAKKSGKEIPVFLREWFEEFKKKQFEAIEKTESQQEQLQKWQAGRVIAGVVRNGIEAMQTGVMSLGGPREERMTHQARTLEQGSSEAFDVMRANVGAPEKDLQKKHVAIAEKQSKTLEDIKKELMKKAKETVVKIAGID